MFVIPYNYCGSCGVDLQLNPPHMCTWKPRTKCVSCSKAYAKCECELPEGMKRDPLMPSVLWFNTDKQYAW